MVKGRWCTGTSVPRAIPPLTVTDGVCAAVVALLPFEAASELDWWSPWSVATLPLLAAACVWVWVWATCEWRRAGALRTLGCGRCMCDQVRMHKLLYCSRRTSGSTPAEGRLGHQPRAGPPRPAAGLAGACPFAVPMNTDANTACENTALPTHHWQAV